MDFSNVPIGFGMELVQNETAMERYAALDESERQALLEQASSITTREEMRQFIDRLTTGLK